MLKNTPPKWTYDWNPEEFKIRKYIFTVWREVCESFWYEEYLTPIVEEANVYRAKSWEDIWWKELTTLNTRWKAELALRPEMTPSVTRLVSREYTKLSKPIRYFSIANFFRNERPQRWRNREFWQLNFDLFWIDSLNADIEIATMCLEIMSKFNPPKDSYVFKINNRKIINTFLEDLLNLDSDKRQEVSRLLDKFEKLEESDFKKMLVERGVDNSEVDKVLFFMNAKTIDELVNKFEIFKDTDWIKELNLVISSLTELWYWDLIKFSPNLIRWFDYYDWTIFEMFDNHPDNNRWLFWGWRYNWLSSLFIKNWFSAVWVAPGDESMRLFLESWGLLDDIKNKTRELYYIPLLENNLMLDINKIAKKLRLSNKKVELWLEKIDLRKALNYANKKNISYTVIYWDIEKKEWIYKIKNMNTWEEESFSF